MRYYLAYGSNLNVADMARRCPGARRAGVVILDDARLVFRGVADVEFAPGRQVPCGLWSITPDDEAQLDRYEGVRTGFYDKYDLDIGRGQTALIYLMRDGGVSPPSVGYLECIREGYGDHEFDEAFLEMALAEAWKNKRHTEQTAERTTRPGHRFAPMPEWLAVERLRRRAV